MCRFVAYLGSDILLDNKLVQHYSKNNRSYYNLCLTDGKRLIASRYCTGENEIPETLHYFTGACFYQDLQILGHESLIISSEKLTDFNAEWQDVPTNSLLLVDYDRSVQLRLLQL
ncbi:class II glutamine amidotransferase [Legionella fairfieldensis]|uniref:class II glutamine amidotransferase n=1 Tax=Legionella fairfieldensis TaxID=45064 RepID=UPI000490BD78|nr:hypothetical protein [Legionella fairfieldensis]